jgi:hypothetical protein
MMPRAAHVKSGRLVGRPWITSITPQVGGAPSARGGNGDKARRERRACGPDASKVARGRRFIGNVLTRWRLDHLAETAILLTSEVMANAALNAGTACVVNISVDLDRGSWSLVSRTSPPRVGDNTVASNGVVFEFPVDVRGVVM